VKGVYFKPLGLVSRNDADGMAAALLMLFQSAPLAPAAAGLPHPVAESFSFNV